MGVVITDLRWNNAYRPTQNLSYLLSCIGERVTLEIDFTYEDIVFGTSTNVLTLAPLNADVNLADTTNVIQTEDRFSFQNYAVGDTIKVFDNNLVTFTTHTIIEIISSGLIRVNASFTNTILIADSYIYNTSAFAGVKYAYNMLSQGNSFTSLIDQEYQQAVIETASASNLSDQDMSFTGLLSYQIGSLTIKGTGLEGLQGATGGGNDDIKQTFTITHNTVITPFFLAAQFQDLLVATKPSYYTANETLNYFSEMSLGRDLTNPNGLQVLTVPNLLSNVGWYNERFNGGINNYVVSSLILTDVALATTVSQLKFGTEIQIDITVQNTTDSPFSDGNTNYTFGFNYLPDDETFYQNNGFDQTRNFVFDSKDNVLGSGSVNGDNFGNNLQVIKTVTSTFVSATEMLVTVIIETGTDADDIIQAGDLNQYKIWLITENHANAAEVSDKVNLLVQVNTFDLELINADAIVSDQITYIEHPFIDESEDRTGADLNLYPVDDIVANHFFLIDFGDIEPSENFKIIGVKSRVLMRDDLAQEADFLLETFNFSTASAPIIGGQAQNIDFTQNRVFKIQDDDIRKLVSFKRDFGSDSGDSKFYKYRYPFMKRWEYWLALVTPIASPASGIFDPTEPLNGLNNFWHRYTTVANWTMFYDIEYTLEQNGVEFTQKFESDLPVQHDFLENPDWINETIRTFDATTLVELINAGEKFIRGYEDVLVEASFTKTVDIPDISNIGIVIWIETFEVGGIADIRRISSYYPISDNSWFKSIDASNKVVITNPSTGTFIGSCLVDSSKLPINQKFTMYARLYEDDLPISKQFEDDIIFEFEDNIIYDFE